MSVLFQDDGPVSIDNEYQEFLNFCQTEHPDFDELYYRWICERYSINFRRFCLRTLLRQTPIRSYRPCPYNTTQQLNRILHIGDGRKKSDLYWTLYNRPSLVNMMTAELIYNLEHEYYGPIEHAASQGVYPLILCLIPLSNEEYAVSQLWKHHPLSQNPTSNKPVSICEKSNWRQTLEAWAFQKNLPKWIRDELWAAIVAGIQPEVEALSCASRSGKPILLSWENTHDNAEYSHLIALCNFIDSGADPSKTDPSIAEAYLTLLEDALPEQVAYLPARESLACLKYVGSFPHNDALTVRIMRRHIPKFQLAAALRVGFQFSQETVEKLYHVLGCAYYNEPLDSDLLKDVPKLIEVAKNHIEHR